ncbi:hypothetical protein [Pseudobutyrivibrio xylanivorans]|uniref:Uncharacterized protein n=1 Tax=Pseudobutyrivibrio xylanivorans DSM 14809 TaxID=1123012 RepID=A0A1M6DQB8_PSEXY|nr:hypothetical protein [Pseudobutyrivibrio xylanivorans]SHI75426.1 hypothetical protein SAMN02745725_00996 [Pseudobutyrivibrio xylanivorans DSM 14809]
MKMIHRLLGICISFGVVCALLVAIQITASATDNSVREDAAVSTVVENSDTTMEEEITIPETETPLRISTTENGNSPIISRVVLTVTVLTLIVLILIAITSHIVRRRNYK